MTMTADEAKRFGWIVESSVASVMKTPTALPLDLVSGCVAAYSTRKVRAAFAGSAIRIRRSSDNTEQDIGFDASGNLDTAAITTFVGSNSAYVVTWYDQSTNGKDCTQASTTLQPRIVNAGTLDTLNTKASPLFDGSNDKMVSGAIGSTATNWTILAVLNHVTNPGTDNIPVAIGGSATTGRSRGLWKTSANTAMRGVCYNANYTSATLTWDTTTAHVYGFSNSASTITLYRDGTADAGGAAGNTLVALNSADYVGLGTFVSNGTEYANSKIVEALFFPSSLSTSDRNLIEDSMAWYYATPVTPRAITQFGIKAQ